MSTTITILQNMLFEKVKFFISKKLSHTKNKQTIEFLQTRFKRGQIIRFKSKLVIKELQVIRYWYKKILKQTFYYTCKSYSEAKCKKKY